MALDTDQTLRAGKACVMAGQHNTDDQAAIFGPLVAVAASGYAVHTYGPVLSGSSINMLPAIAAIILVFASLTLLGNLISYLGGHFKWKFIHKPTGLKGTAGWVNSLSEIKHELDKRSGPYWGVFKGTPLFSRFQSSAMCLGPSRSGKGVRILIPSILTIFESKFWVCFKAETSCVVKKVLEKRGEILHVLNIGNMFTDILGKTAHYNPLEHTIFRFLEIPGGILKVDDMLAGLSLQLYPEPKSDSGEGDDFWRAGSRKLIKFAVLVCVLVYGKRANLGNVQQLLSNRNELLRYALWIAGRMKKQPEPGAEDQEDEYLPALPIENYDWCELHDAEDVENFIIDARDTAGEISDLLQEKDDRKSSSFLEGATKSLRPFNRSTHAYKVLSRSTFSFSDMKGPIEEDANDNDNENISLITKLVKAVKAWIASLFAWTKPRPQAVNVSIVLDSASPTEQGKIATLLQWCFQTEVKAHPNKQRSVYFLADEMTNYIINDLQSMLTWTAGYSLHFFLIFQSFSAFISKYGRECLNTALSETEIKLILPGTREPDTLELIEKILGNRSVVVQGHTSKKKTGAFDTDGSDFKEDGQPILTAEEAGRIEKGILKIRKNRPIAVSLPPIFAIAPLRKQIDPNPFHGTKSKLDPVLLRLPHPDGGWLVRLLRRLFAPKPQHNGDDHA